MSKEWRCFHCDEVFTEETRAKEHFGIAEDRTPACQVAAKDGGILRIWREAESDMIRCLHAMHDENREALVALRGLEGRLARMVREADEAGYAKGLADANEQYVEPAKAENAQLRARLSTAEAVIGPFAQMAKRADHYTEEVCPPMTWPVDGTKFMDGPGFHTVDAADFRAAAEWLKGE